MRETVIRCDGCGERLPDTGLAHYTVVLTCLAGPNRDKVQPPPHDLCGFCASIVRNVLIAHSQGHRPASLEVAGQKAGL